MPKTRRQPKRARKTRSHASRKPKPKKPAKPTLKERLARAKKLEALDAGKPTFKVLPRALRAGPDNVRTAPPSVITGSVGRWERGARNLHAAASARPSGRRPISNLSLDATPQRSVVGGARRTEHRTGAATGMTTIPATETVVSGPHATTIS